VVNIIYHVENANLTRYTGNYDDFVKMYELKKRQKEQAYEKQQKEIGHLEDFIARNKARVATSNMAKSRQKKLDKMDMIQLDREKPKPIFQFKEARTPGRYLIEAKGLVIGYQEPLTRSIDLLMERGEKIAIRGVNGLGKSTLLRTLLGKQPALAGDIDLDPFLHTGYFEQESLGGSQTALDEITLEFPSLTLAEARAALAKCGLTNDHITSQVRVLSGGEAAKVRLCKLLNRELNLLVLDEPTNHLDVEAKEELGRALRAFKGSILLVSHEPEFYQDWVTKVWNVENWTTKIV
jgi:ATPase subunit of ABC transporter with duplicated ATPase domains